MTILEKISDELVNGNSEELLSHVEEALDEGLSANEILDNGLIKGMSIVGALFRDGEIFIPEVLISARAMTKGIERLEPLMLKSGIPPKGKLMIGTVQDDLHDIGKNLVAIMFKGAGFEIIDLGVNVSAEKFVQEARKHQPDVIGLSALLTTTMMNMEKIVQLLKENGIPSIIIVGGAPVSEEYANLIHADLFAKNAVEGVEKVLNAMAS
ncbi:MAG: cobalamin-binding protein [Candidatus Marinimicrobia bacterium CG08_land_8_20_14_0_20_45_22]|nr:MAG: cobalamin-binding protein [Candidatus Marinimicrobia bacterium CG08_land_8_20_14_0_20_45_22]